MLSTCSGNSILNIGFLYKSLDSSSVFNTNFISILLVITVDNEFLFVSNFVSVVDSFSPNFASAVSSIPFVYVAKFSSKLLYP